MIEQKSQEIEQKSQEIEQKSQEIEQKSQEIEQKSQEIELQNSLIKNMIQILSRQGLSASDIVPSGTQCGGDSSTAESDRRGYPALLGRGITGGYAIG